MKKIICFTLFIAAFTSCFQEKFEKETVLSNISDYYKTNKSAFDSLALYITDSTKDRRLVKGLTSVTKFKAYKGYGRALFSDSGHINYKPTWYLKEYGYGIQCGLFFDHQAKENRFENPRMVYRRIEGGWFSYIYFN
jgi:hypothetical protein